MNLKGIGLFALGTLFGLEGIRLLSSRDAKKVYAQCTAGVLRVKDSVLTQATVLQENCVDIYEEAKVINEERARKEEEAEIIDEEDENKAEEIEITEEESENRAGDRKAAAPVKRTRRKNK